MRLLIFFSIFYLLIHFVASARILIILPIPSLSHHMFHQHIIQGISLRGHEVISVTPHPINDPKLTNLTEIDIHDEAYAALNAAEVLKDAQVKKQTIMDQVRYITPIISNVNEAVLRNSKVRDMIDNPEEHFDLLIVEMMFNTALLAFKERFNCPMIGLTSLDTTLNGMDAIGNPPNPSYYVGFNLRGGYDLTFWERFNNLWFNIEFRLYYHFTFIPTQSELIRRYFGDKITNHNAWDIEKSIDLLMVNTNPTFHIPRPHVPTYIEIGGLHLRERKPLPKDLKKILDDSKQGVVYFSLGSNIKSGTLPDQIRNNILKAFEQLPYNILWKWENDTLPNKPKNVFTRQWLPQQDVLDHPNVKAFVTQGGLQSLEEAIRSAVPMIGIPFGADQQFNVQRIVSLGIGKEVRFDELTVESLVNSINEVASLSSYKNKISTLSTIIWDQETKPLDRAMWWIEYVIRHGGAKHLRTPAADLPWYKFLLLDIFAFIFTILLIALITLRYVMKIIVIYCFKSKTKYKKE